MAAVGAWWIVRCVKANWGALLICFVGVIAMPDGAWWRELIALTALTLYGSRYRYVPR